MTANHTFSTEQVDLFRQWFNAVLDMNQQYLERRDYELAEQIHKALGMRWSVPRNAPEDLATKALAEAWAVDFLTHNPDAERHVSIENMTGWFLSAINQALAEQGDKS